MIATIHSEPSERGGPSTRLPGIVGRGRAFEILLGGEDFDGELAERYGYVNRAVPDAEFVEFISAATSS
jgi:enoyl-CoA hydratase/carnithine racemase